jgi:anaerobic magnesium-protoporphyrin IX monomethyl ester cyclase
MVDVLITHSYFLRFDPKQWRAQQPYPPLATLFASAVLLKESCRLVFHDMMFAQKANEIEDILAKNKPKYFIICDDGFNYLTKMCLTNMRDAAFEMASIAKKYGCKVIVSSSDSTDHSADYLSANFDYVIVGEAEQTLKELVEALNNHETDFASINGLRYFESDSLVETKSRENLKELDLLPQPAWQLLDIEPYKKAWMKSKGFFSINVATTRGCPYKCNWCAKPIYGNRYNSRSPQNVVDELMFLKANFNFDHIWFCDDIFGLKPNWVSEFANLVEKKQLKIKYKIQSRVDLLLEESLVTNKKETQIEALARSGCDEVWVGAESGSQKILDAMDKGTKVAQIAKATQLMKQHKIKPCFFLQFGYSNETYIDIKMTLKMLFELMPHDIGISVSYPLPGTKFYDTVKEQMRGKTNWTDSDELAIMFNATYPADFYRKLQRFVHYKFRQKQAMNALKEFREISKIASLAYRIPQTFLAEMSLKKYIS